VPRIGPIIRLLASFLLVTLLAAPQHARADSSATKRMFAGPIPDSTVAFDPRPVDVRGVVRDANGSPIRGATIRLTSETDTVRVHSDGAGRFHARITAGRDVLVLVRAYGYRDMIRDYRASGRPIDAALALPPPYPLGGVTITALRPPRFESEASAAVMVPSAMFPRIS